VCYLSTKLQLLRHILITIRHKAIMIVVGLLFVVGVVAIEI